jgi:hypothetical protein
MEVCRDARRDHWEGPMADTGGNARAADAGAEPKHQAKADESGATKKPEDDFDNEFWVSDNPAGCGQHR